MPTKPNLAKLATDLRSLAAQLESIANDLDGTGTATKSTRDRVAKRLAERICLSCDEPIPKKSRVIRGCHSVCYFRLKRLIDKNEVTTDELARAGRITEESKTGGRTSEAADKIRREVSRIRNAKK